MNTIVDENKVVSRLILAFALVLLGAIWIISSLSNVSYKVEDNMAMLVQDHLPKLDTIYAVQSNVKTHELILYNYYETTDSLAYHRKWQANLLKMEQLLSKLDKSFVNEVNQYLINLNTIAQAFDAEMQHPETDWDELRNQLSASTKISDEFNLQLSEHTKSIRSSFKHYSDNTETLIAKMVISQIAFSGFVLVLLVVLAFVLKGMLKQHKINRELALYPEQNPYPIIRLDKNREPIYLNPAALNLAQTLNCVDVPSKLLPTDNEQQMFTLKSEQDSYKSKHYLLGNRMFSAIFNRTSNDDSVYAYLLDVTDRVKAENELIHRSNHDLLTGLPNRRHLEEILKLKTQSSLTPFTLAFIKVSGLDLVNASLGHEMSDKVLQAMSQRLENFINHVSDGELGLYSFESSSWVVICNQSSPSLHTKQLGDNLLSLFASALSIGDLGLTMHCNVGLTTFPRGGSDAEQLLRNADTALRQGIKEGLSVRLYSEDLTEQAMRLLAIEQGLKHALDKGEFILNIQPKVDTQTGQFVGGEVLIRWKYNDMYISPAEFIPIAEESDLIIGIGEWVLSTACKQWVKWSDEGLEPQKIAVNISARHFIQVGFVDYVSHTLIETGMPPSFLELEITEEVATANPEKLIDTMMKLKELGLSLAIDDFGTGYSSLSYLMQFPIDTLKIDKAFVTNMAKSDNDAALVRMIMSLAKELKLDVVAEGVETKGEHEALAALGCEYIQGYYFYKPMPLDSYKALLSA